MRLLRFIHKHQTTLGGVLMIVLVIFWGIHDGRRSCQYNQALRPALQAAATSFRQAAERSRVRAHYQLGMLHTLDMKGYYAELKLAQELNVPKLNCSALLPGVPKVR